MLSQFQQSHLVTLVGYCDDGEEMILVYDYMPSGSLSDHLYKRVRNGDTSLPSLTWVQRLHTGTSILLKFQTLDCPKIGPANQTCTFVSTRVKGTHGYLDPYYVATRRLTRKSDVYAFGVVLFEVLCGRPAVDVSLDEEQISLAGWAQQCFKEGLLEQIIDPYIKKNISSDSLDAYVDVTIKCLNNQPKFRPTMAEVVVRLESALALQEKSTYYTLVEIIPDDYTQEDVDSSKLNVKDANHNRKHEITGEAIVKGSHNLHRNKHSSARLTFTKRFSALLSVTTRVFSGNRDAKSSRYSNGLLLVNSNKPQAANHQSLPVYPSMPLKPWGQEEVLRSTKLKSFELNDLKVATRKFHRDSVLGEGGFGSVYKGWIDEKTYGASKWGTGLVIAVKRLNLGGFQGQREWLAEINSLGTLSHPNLIKLIGYCEEKEHRLLVYEFMPQGSLEVQLWKAKGLAYLHSPEASVIYRDFKTSNILLDSKYNAKLSDLGLAKSNRENESTHISTVLMGTYGYAAPEYMATGHLCLKSDVFSFGVVLLEILAGRCVIDKTLPATKQNLVDWAKPYLTSKRKILHVMDADIKGQYTVKEALSASSLTLKCLSGDPKLRPDANYVVKALEQLQDLKN